MADVSKLNADGVIYDIKDAVARRQVEKTRVDFQGTLDNEYYNKGKIDDLFKRFESTGSTDVYTTGEVDELLKPKLDRRESNNLLHLKDTTYEQNGVTVTIKDNHVSIKGTTTTGSYYRLPLELDSLQAFKAGLTYICSFQNVESNSSALISFMLWGAYSSSDPTAYTALGIPKSIESGLRYVNIPVSEQDRALVLTSWISQGNTLDIEFDFMINYGTKYLPFEEPINYKGRLPYGSVYPYTLSLQDSNSILATYGITDAYTKSEIQDLNKGLTSYEFGTGNFTYDTGLYNFTTAMFYYQKIGKFVIVKLRLIGGTGTKPSGCVLTGLPYISNCSGVYERLLTAKYNSLDIYIEYNTNKITFKNDFASYDTLLATIMYQISM